MTTRKELVEALRVRYRGAAFGDRIQILDEFVALTGYHRKHAIRVLREEIATAKGGAYPQPSLRRGGAPGADRVVGEAADRVCGKRLTACSRCWSMQWNATTGTPRQTEVSA